MKKLIAIAMALVFSASVAFAAEAAASATPEKGKAVVSVKKVKKHKKIIVKKGAKTPAAATPTPVTK
jgi:hypothetical protein